MTILVVLISVEVHGVCWVNRFVVLHRIVCDSKPNVTKIAIRGRNSNPWLVLRVSDLPQSNRDRNRYPGGLHSPDEAAGMGKAWGCWVSRKRHVYRLQDRGTVQG